MATDFVDNHVVRKQVDHITFNNSTCKINRLNSYSDAIIKNLYLNIKTNVTKDGKIKKYIIKEGTGERPPCTALVVTMLSSCITTEKNKISEPYLFRVGHAGIYGLNFAVLSMRLNEISSFVIHPDYGYGSIGLHPHLPPNSTIFVQVELCRFLDTGNVFSQMDYILLPQIMCDLEHFDDKIDEKSHPDKISSLTSDSVEDIKKTGETKNELQKVKNCYNDKMGKNRSKVEKNKAEANLVEDFEPNWTLFCGSRPIKFDSDSSDSESNPESDSTLIYEEKTGLEPHFQVENGVNQDGRQDADVENLASGNLVSEPSRAENSENQGKSSALCVLSTDSFKKLYPEALHHCYIAMKFCEHPVDLKKAIREYSLALRTIQKAEIEDPMHLEKKQKLLVTLYTNLALCYNNDNEPKKTCRMCHYIYDLKNENSGLKISSKVYFHHGRALAMLGNFQAARAKLIQAKRLDPKSIVIKDELVKIDLKYEQNRLKDKNNSRIDTFRKEIENICSGLIKDDNRAKFKLPNCKLLSILEKNTVREVVAKAGLSIEKDEDGLAYVVKK